MNPKFFIADIVFLIAFIVQGMETHDSESSFIEISMPYAIAQIMAITMMILNWLGLEHTLVYSTHNVYILQDRIHSVKQ